MYDVSVYLTCRDTSCGPFSARNGAPRSQVRRQALMHESVGEIGGNCGSVLRGLSHAGHAIQCQGARRCSERAAIFPALRSLKQRSISATKLTMKAALSLVISGRKLSTPRGKVYTSLAKEEAMRVRHCCTAAIHALSFLPLFFHRRSPLSAS